MQKLHGSKEPTFMDWLADRYTINPIMSTWAYDEFVTLDGEVLRSTNRVFGVAAMGTLAATEEVLTATLRNLLKTAFPPGTYMTIRRLPEWSEESIGPKSKLTIRIGTFIEPLMGLDVPDCSPLPDVSVVKDVLK